MISPSSSNSSVDFAADPESDEEAPPFDKAEEVAPPPTEGAEEATICSMILWKSTGTSA